MATSETHNTSPISQLLTTLGLTREDLQQRSDEMRHFLTAETAKSRVSSRVRANSSSSNPNRRSLSRSNSIAASSVLPLSRTSSVSLRDASPSPTPVKSEPTEAALPPRQYDNMEMVIERQRQARKEKRQKREKEREITSRSHGSPTPSSASAHSLFDSRPQRRDDDFFDAKEPFSITSNSSTEARASPPPLTPQQAKYYREHTASQSLMVIPKAESPASISIPQQSLQEKGGLLFPYPQYHSQAQILAQLQTAQLGGSADPITPQKNRILTPNKCLTKSPLPPSSSPAGTPQSSPIRPIVNLVSSPGPMGPAPNEDNYNKPYTLPPGPYSPNKPDLSYAALLGQAILSSLDHRLTLQEIYDWITIVYPFFKRGETTWMNSIRHVLSTTACFRKVTRDRTLGRTQWAIWDEDLECFKNGGFRKQFCKDMNGGKTASEIQRGKRGRKSNEDDIGCDRKSKKVKKDKQQTVSSVPSHPIFPPSRPQVQSYVDSAISADVMFPPLPASSGFRQLTVNVNPSVAPSSRALSAQTEGDDGNLESSSPTSDGIFHHPPSSASTSSVPELTPNCSSSSPPPSTSDLDLDAPINIIAGNDKGKEREVFQSFVNLSDLGTSDEEEPEQEDDMFAATKLTPVQDWGNLSKRKELSKPARLRFNDIPATYPTDSEDEQDHLLLDAVKKKNARQKKSSLDDAFERLPASPTRKSKSKSSTSKLKTKRTTRLSTPPPINAHEGPSTPPQNRRVQLSPVHTPISHKGLHMSPSTSLAHYKSHLDPPPVLPHDIEHPIGEFLLTPSRGRTLGFSGTPVTPKRSSNFSLLDESPFRLFRTPGSRGILDPHDPRTLLDDELNRLGEHQDSPAAGFYGRRQLLYTSPGTAFSPGRWR